MAFAALLSLVAGAMAVRPVLFFPGYGFSKLRVNVTAGTVNGCPSDGVFDVEFGSNEILAGFGQACQFNYLEVRNTNNAAPFTARSDVKIDIPGRTTGDTNCLGGKSLYDPLINYFVAHGYTINSPQATFYAACYDWRMSPDTDVIPGPTFLENTMNLVKQAYNVSGGERVWLIGHSNGPIQALHFLNTVSEPFKRQYIAGFIPISGNFAGQGLFPVVYVEGLIVTNFSFLVDTVAVHRGWTGNYFSGPQPAVFTGPKNLTFLVTDQPNKTYDVTVAGLNQFFTDTNNSFGLANWARYAGLVGPHTPPFVYTFALWGAGIQTAYGVHIPSFDNISLLEVFTRPGDINQEDIDNESPLVWANSMRAGCFEHWEVVGVDHFSLSGNATVIARIFGVVNNTVWIECTNSTTAPTSAPTTAAKSSAESLAVGLAAGLVFLLL